MLRAVLIVFGVLLISSTPALANTGYSKCKRLGLIHDGFRSLADAARWYPETQYIVYSADNKRSASFYGISEKRAKVHREYGMSTIRRQGGLTIDLRHEDFDRDKSVLRVTYSQPGFQESTPSIYSCGPGKKTSWWPEED